MICFMRHHWVSLLKEILQFIAFAAVGIISLIYIEDVKNLLRGNLEIKMFFLTGFLTYTILLNRCFLKILNYFVNIGIITNLRFIDHKKTLFFRDTIDSIDLGQIQNIEQIENGLFPNLLGYGDLKIFLNASAAVKTYHRLPNIKFHFRCINRQKEARQKELSEQMFTTERTHQFIDKISGIETKEKPPQIIREQVEAESQENL